MAFDSFKDNESTGTEVVHFQNNRLQTQDTLDYKVSDQFKNFGADVPSSFGKDSDEYSDVSGMIMLKDGSVASSSFAS